MRKPAFGIYENKDADQLRGNREADQRLCFRYTDSTIPLLPIKIRKFKPLTIFCDCTARFVSDLVGNPEDRFSHNEADIMKIWSPLIRVLGRMHVLISTSPFEMFIFSEIFVRIWAQGCGKARKVFVLRLMLEFVLRYLSKAERFACNDNALYFNNAMKTHVYR